MKNDAIFTWKYTIGNNSFTSANKSNTFYASEISKDGDYSITVSVEGKT